MTLLLPEERALDRGPSRFVLAGPRAEPLLTRRLGDRLHVGVLEGPLGRAEVVRVGPGSTVELEAVLDMEPPPRPTTRLLLAFHRPKSLRRLLPQLAAMGLAELTLFRSWRVDRAYLASESLAPARLVPLLHDGLEQAGSTWAPQLRVYPRFMDLVDAERRPPGGAELRILAHPRASVLGREASARPAGTSLAIGPEGGLLDEEVARLTEVGYRPRRMELGVVRVETAVVAALAQLRLLESWLPCPQG